MRQPTNNNRPSQPPPRRPPPARPPKQALLRTLFPPADRADAPNTQNTRKPTSRPLTAVVVTRSPPILGPTTTALSVPATTSRTTRAAAAAKATPSSTRTPLRTRDRNAAWAVRPASTPRLPPPRASLLNQLPSAATDTTPSAQRPRRQSQKPTMRSLKTAASPASGYDKDTPRKPTLASRPISRAPLTPKIASTAAPRTPGQGRDGGVAAGPFIASNVTPRSGTRQSRVDSGNTTPNYGTPTAQNHWDVRPGGLGGPGLSPAASALDERLHTVAAQGGSAASSADSKFFYASDAKPAASSAAAPPPPPSLGPPSRASTFFYASGQSLPSPQLQQQQPATNTATPPLLSSVAGASGTPPPDLSSKFVHANGAALDRPHTITPKGPGSVMSGPATAHGALPAKRAAMSSRAPPSAVATTPYGASQQRPLSPVKRTPVSPFSPLQKRGSFPLSNSNPRAPEAPTSQPFNSTPTVPPLPSPGPASPGNGSGRFDLLTRQRTGSSGGGHSRKGSLTIADPPTVARLLQSSQPSSETSSPAASVHFASPSFPFPSTAGGSATSTAATGLAAILQASEDLGDSGADEDGSADHADSNGQGDAEAPAQQETSATSPGSSPPPASSHVDELVANARRERKVQDLEITNASLEAINRSLERQMRKQKAELRQFRRLSRSGRLSLAPSSASAAASRVTSSSSTVYEGPLQDPERMFSILSEDDSDGGEDGGYDDGDDYASDMEVSFNEETAENGDENDDENDDSSSDTSRQKRRRKRDERRLQLDLSKHRQLLVDSQKINQSIKRCLGWTEALIQEGQKALAFQVRVSEVQLGGRVLAVDELEGDGDTHTVVSDAVVGEPLEIDEGEQKSDITLADPFIPNTNYTHHKQGRDDDNGQDSRDEAFSPISQKSRNVRFDMDVQGDAIHEKSKTSETSETTKDTAQAASPLVAPAPSEPEPATAAPSTVPNVAASPVPEPDISPEESPAPALVPAADSVPTPSLSTEDDTTKTQPTGVEIQAAEQPQNDPAHENVETGMQTQPEPMHPRPVEAVAA